MQLIPIQDVFSQSFQVQLANQSCSINIYQNDFGLFFDLSVSGTLIIGGVVCQNMNRIVRDLYLGFVGDFCFVDAQGSEDPISPGLGTRFFLVYLDAFDLAQGQG
jgi:hypothetical protein